MEPPTATMAICPAESWWRRPSSLACSEAGSEGMEHDIKNRGIAQAGWLFVGRLGDESKVDKLKFPEAK
jgi:hypothetical protein